MHGWGDGEGIGGVDFLDCGTGRVGFMEFEVVLLVFIGFGYFSLFLMF